MSFVNYVLTLLLQFVGLKYTSAASASVIVGLEPLLMVFVGHFSSTTKRVPTTGYAARRHLPMSRC